MSNLKRNITYNTFYQVLQIILPLITAPYLSRVLGPEAIGAYAYAASIASYFVLFGMLGIANYGNRCIALNSDDNERKKLFGEIYSVQLMSTSLVTFFYILYCLLFVNKYKNVFFTQILFLVSSILDISWLYFGLEKFRVTVIRNTVIKLVTVICILLFVKDQDDLCIYSIIMTGGMLISQFVLWIQAKDYLIHVKFGVQSVLLHMRSILILFIPIIAYSIYKIMDKIMLGSMTSLSQVGYYENAERFINIPISFIAAFGTVMMPRISTLLSKSDYKVATEYNSLSFKYFSVIILAIFWGLFGVSDVLIPVFYGIEFVDSTILLKVLSCTLLFITWSNIIRTQILIPNKEDKPYVISTIVGAIVNLGLNAIFIPIIGAMGAAVATVAAEATVFIVQALYVRKIMDVFLQIVKISRFMVYGIIMCFLVRFIGKALNESVITLVLQVFLGGMTYCVMVFIDFYYFKDPLLQKLKK